MRKDLVWALVGFLFMGAALWMTVSDAGWSESRWSTDYGPIELRIRDDGSVEGEYPDYGGRLIGVLRPNEKRVLGFWEQTSSERPCDTPRGDTLAWGRFNWTLEGRNRILGAWSYCNEEPSGEKLWDGTFVDGIHPLDADVEPQID